MAKRRLLDKMTGKCPGCERDAKMTGLLCQGCALRIAELAGFHVAKFNCVACGNPIEPNPRLLTFSLCWVCARLSHSVAAEMRANLTPLEQLADCLLDK